MKKDKKVYYGFEAQSIAETLKEIGMDKKKWEIYYIDEDTGEKWMLDYPEASYHGGGEPRLRKIEEE